MAYVCINIFYRFQPLLYRAIQRIQPTKQAIVNFVVKPGLFQQNF